MKEVFINDKIDILNNQDNYYFFRALNNGDNDDREKGLNTDKEGNLIKIRTDQERYEKSPKYHQDSQISLEEVFDHIKPDHRKDTNCISLTTSANVALLYGREYYKDRYILVKIPKKEAQSSIINAFLYLVEEINKKINFLLLENKISPQIKYYLEIIDNSQTQTTLNQTIKNITTSTKEFIFTKNHKFDIKNDTLVEFQALNEYQNFEKDKIIAKLTLLDINIIPDVPNQILIQTIINAYSSLEFIHYQTITKDKITELSKEVVDLFALIQQIPKDYPNLQTFKQDFLKLILTNKLKPQPFTYHFHQLKKETNHDNEIFNIYQKSFYLAKSKLRSIEMIEYLKSFFGKNQDYQMIMNYLQTNTYGVEPQIFSNQHSNSFKINEFVSLDFNEKERIIFNFINSLNLEKLKNIINNPTIIFDYYFQFKNQSSYTFTKRRIK